MKFQLRTILLIMTNVLFQNKEKWLLLAFIDDFILDVGCYTYIVIVQNLSNISS